MRFTLAALAAALCLVGIALLTGPHWYGAVVGTSLSGLAGVATVFAIAALARWGKPTIGTAMVVMGVGFMIRLVLVAAGTVAVVRNGESVPGFVVGFFVTFFTLVAIEALFVHRLGRGVAA